MESNFYNKWRNTIKIIVKYTLFAWEQEHLTIFDTDMHFGRKDILSLDYLMPALLMHVNTAY